MKKHNKDTKYFKLKKEEIKRTTKYIMIDFSVLLLNSFLILLHFIVIGTINIFYKQDSPPPFGDQDLFDIPLMRMTLKYVISGS